MDIEKLRAKYEALTNKSNNAGNNDEFLKKFMKLETGPNIVRILPPKDPEKEFYAATKIHRLPPHISNLSGQAKNIHCLRTIGQKCPVCEVYYNMWDLGDEDSIKIARAIKPRERYYMNVYDRESGEVKILSVGIKLYTNILEHILDPDVGDITDPKTGFDFKIVKEMVSTNGMTFPNYEKSKALRNPSVLADSDKEINRIIEQSHDIHSLVKHEEYEEVKKKVDAFMHGPSLSADPPEGSQETTVSDVDYEKELNT